MEVKCPNCFYKADSWSDFISINNVLECPECEEHFKLIAIPLVMKTDEEGCVSISSEYYHLLKAADEQYNFLEDLNYKYRKQLATAVEALKRELRAMEYVIEDEDIKGTYSERIATESAARIKEALAEIGGKDD